MERRDSKNGATDERRDRRRGATARGARPQEERDRKKSATARTAARGVGAENRKLGGEAAERPTARGL
jgi:hypothetical protein